MAERNRFGESTFEEEKTRVSSASSNRTFKKFKTMSTVHMLLVVLTANSFPCVSSQNVV